MGGHFLPTGLKMGFQPLAMRDSLEGGDFLGTCGITATIFSLLKVVPKIILWRKYFTFVDKFLHQDYLERAN